MVENHKQQRIKQLIDELSRKINLAFRLFLVLVVIGVIALTAPQSILKVFESNPKITSVKTLPVATKKAPEIDEDVANGIHQPSGLIADEGYELVMGTCGACHSLKLVTANRATKQGWIDMIRWMQETQKLWDLGENEEAIVNYLAKNYAPQNKGRRENLTNIEWYEL